MAKWGYQMTPWDAWDYDGINEHLLLDLNDRRQADQDAGALRPQRLRLPARPHERHADLGREVRAEHQLGRSHRSEDGPSRREPRQAHQAGRRDQGHLPGGDGRQESAAGVVLAEHQPDLRGHQQPLHELRRRRGAVHRGRAVRRRERADLRGPGRESGRVHRVESGDRRSGCGGSRSRSRSGPARSSTAGDVAFYGTMDGWFKAVNAKTGTPLWKSKLPSGSIAQPDHVPGAGPQAVHRHLLGHRRLVRPADCGQPLA